MTKDEVKKLRMNSPESLQFLNNATKFYNLMMMYRCAIREIQTKLEVLDDEFSVENNRNPISFIKTRIKKPNSIYNKLQKMGYEFTTENIQTYLNDVAGVRIVCAFIDDIYMISDLITQQDDIKVIETSVYKGYKQDKIEMRGDRAEMSDFPLYLNTVAGGLDRRDQTIGGFSFVVKIYALPVVEIIGQLLYLLGRYGFNAQFGDCL